MLAATLKFQFTTHARMLDRNLGGITDEEALIQPAGGGNCLNWVLGHIVASREPILSLLGEALDWDPTFVRRYERGSAPVASAADALAPLAEIREAFTRSQERLLRGLDTISPEELEEAVGDDTRGQRLAFLQLHEAYHIGQTGLLRRLVGKSGAIQ